MSVTLIASYRGPRPAKILASLLAATCALCAAAQANAAPGHDAVPRVVVSYKDLNLSKPGDVTILFQRIESAARRVCQTEDRFNLRALQLSDSCRREAVARAVGAVGSPTLNALLNRKWNLG